MVEKWFMAMSLTGGNCDPGLGVEVYPCNDVDHEQGATCFACLLVCPCPCLIACF